MADSFTFTPPVVNSNRLVYGNTQNKETGNTESLDIVSTGSLGSASTVTALADSSGYTQLVMNTGAPDLTVGEFILVNKSGDADTKLNGYHRVKSWTDPTGVLWTPWETCFTGVSAGDVKVYHTTDIVETNPVLHHFSASVPDSMRVESVHSLPVLTTTVYTADYNAFSGDATRCQKSTTADDMGADTELTDPKVHISNGTQVFSYSIL